MSSALSVIFAEDGRESFAKSSIKDEWKWL